MLYSDGCDRRVMSKDALCPQEYIAEACREAVAKDKANVIQSSCGRHGKVLNSS